MCVWYIVRFGNSELCVILIDTSVDVKFGWAFVDSRCFMGGLKMILGNRGEAILTSFDTLLAF